MEKIAGGASKDLQAEVKQVKIDLGGTIPAAAKYLHQLALSDQTLKAAIDPIRTGSTQIQVPYSQEEFRSTQPYRRRFVLDTTNKFVIHALEHGLRLYNGGARLPTQTDD